VGFGSAGRSFNENNALIVIPAKAEIQANINTLHYWLDADLRRHDGGRRRNERIRFRPG
jgi:hypothetical protein